jgi:hypothetical protein
MLKHFTLQEKKIQQTGRHQRQTKGNEKLMKTFKNENSLKLLKQIITWQTETGICCGDRRYINNVALMMSLRKYKEIRLM